MLGSRPVFLIHWNRERKRLRILVDGPGLLRSVKRSHQRGRPSLARFRHSTAVTLLIAVLGCGGTSSNTTTASGNGSALAAFIVPTTCQNLGLPFGSASVAILSIVIVTNASIPNICSLLTDGCTNYANSHYLMLFVENFDQTGATASPVGTGTYRLVQNFNNTLTGTAVGAAVGGTDASCNAVEDMSGASSTGTITIANITAASVTGSFDVTVGGTEYRADLDAMICPPSDFTVAWSGCSENISALTCTGTTRCLALPPTSG